MRNHVCLIFLLGCLFVFPLYADEVVHGIDPKTFDTKTKPCDDFYQFANGAWLANTPIPPDRSSWGAGSELFERNNVILHEILEGVAKDTNAPKGSITRKVGDFYRLGMDEKKIESDGIKPLSEEFGRIDAIKNVEDLVDEIASLHRKMDFPAFTFTVEPDFYDSTHFIPWMYQGGLGLPNRDYYTSDDEKMKEIRKEYVAHIQKMFELMGDKTESAAAAAKTVMDMETRLAKVSMTPVEQRDPKAITHNMTLAEFSSSTGNFAWNRYFDGIGLKEFHHMNVGQPLFFKEVVVMMKDVPLADWKTYLRWNLINGAAAYVNSAFVDEDFHFNGAILTGAKEIRPRWKRVLETTDNLMGEALGQLYVAKAFPPEAKAKALELVQNLKFALRDRLTTLDWIGEDTRKQALKKLDAMMIKIGYPDKWRDYSTLAIDKDSYVENVGEAAEFEFQRKLNKIGKPVDRTEWGMSPPTVNAYYNPTFNEIVFPAGILQPPFFDSKADDASNYGGIGMVIGHELTHGFDDQGKQFDAEGNLKNWWTAEDEKNYAERAAFIEKQYNNYVVLENLHINGKLTLGENIADLGGLKIAYMAFQKAMQGKSKTEKIDGFTPDQRFFIANAQAWRRNTRPEALRLMIASDPHSPARFRVMGPLSNTPEFNQAFACQGGTKSVTNQVTIW